MKAAESGQLNRAWWQRQRVVVTGGRGFLGSRLVKLIQDQTDASIVTFGSRDYDLTQQAEVIRMYADTKPEIVIHLAARVGGIGANRANPGRFFYENAVMGIEVMEQARLNAVAKFVAVGTVCAYPKFTPVPFHEDTLWDGYPEETNAPYGLAKKMLLVQAQAYRDQYGFNAIYLLPVNLYGPGDNYDPDSSHVIPALIKKMVDARESGAADVSIWGTGSATREFLYVDDAARGIALAAERYNGSGPVNLGSAFEISIRDLVDLIRELTGYRGEIVWDSSKPDGQPRRKLNTDRATREFGFTSEVSFRDGLAQTIATYEDAKQGSVATRA